MSDPAKYWPGGIPSHVRCHPEPIGWETLPEEVKGWQLFLEENAVVRRDGNDDENFEVTQRRQLVSRWAALPQADRDGYQARGTPRDRERFLASYGDKVWYPREALQDRGPTWRDRSGKESQNLFCVCTAPYPLNPRNRAIWTKLRIMTYALDGGDRTMFGYHSDPGAGLLVPNAAGPNPVTAEKYMRWCHVEAADLDKMAMTSAGTVIFYSGVGRVLLTDQQALESGPMLLCGLENNGQVMVQARVWPFTLYRHWPDDGWDAERMILEYNLDMSPRLSKANMEDDILDILEGIRGYVPGSPDVWLDYIERYAPGYLEMEAEGDGMVYDYDHSRFRTTEELESLDLEDDEVYPCPGRRIV
ncbi:hypothetical protein PG993_000007 [Apiospora rasikravindrae]|uniref:Uncharacterized protein n=1 Tax=Apiospora rasikravindrae TaxID=990691 RepID=A0ABR1U791_9PEZI